MLNGSVLLGGEAAGVTVNLWSDTAGPRQFVVNLDPGIVAKDRFVWPYPAKEVEHAKFVLRTLEFE